MLLTLKRERMATPNKLAKSKMDPNKHHQHDDHGHCTNVSEHCVRASSPASVRGPGLDRPTQGTPRGTNAGPPLGNTPI